MDIRWEKITGIYELEGLGDTPASAMISTGEIFINPAVFWQLSEDERLFILLHEAGHIILNTKNELSVDQFATEQYIKMGGSLAATVGVFDKMKMDSPVRQYEQLKRVLHHDAHENGNIHALNSLFGSPVKNKLGVIPEPINNSKRSMLQEDEMAGWVQLALAGVALGGGYLQSNMNAKSNENLAKINAQREQTALNIQGRVAEKMAELQAKISGIQMSGAVKIITLIGVFALVGFVAFKIIQKRKRK